MERSPVDLAELLQPYPCKVFMNSAWGRRFLHVRGPREKFSALLPWRVLNRILREHRFTRPRLVLTKEGAEVPDSEFIGHFRDRRGQSVPQIMASELNERLRQGYTLVLNQVDELYEPITALAESLEYEFRERTQVNAYAAWGQSHGFNLHRDDHDVFVLQIAGRKNWRVCGLSESGNPPKDAEWEGIMEEGDLLYMPKGCWHEARAEGEATLHLTCGIQNRTGIDLLRWMQQELQRSKVYRAELPRFASRDDQLQHVAKLRGELNRVFDDAILDRFFTDYDARALSRLHLSLPWGIKPDALPDRDDVRLRFTLARPVQVNSAPDGGDCELLANGKRWLFPMHFEPILQILATRRHCLLSELYKCLPPSVSAHSTRGVVLDLVFHGLVSIVSS
jgi:hypothetical protein